MKKIDKNNYDYIAYIDASGDDGLINPAVKTKGSSSLVQTVAYFFENSHDDEFNNSILQKLKHQVGLSTEKEIKYRHIRKAHNRKEVFKILNELRGSLISVTYFKKSGINEE